MSETKLPKIPMLHPIKVAVTAGSKYYWCSCGLSTKQPFCDGSHVSTGFFLIEWVAEESKVVGFYGCQYSEKSPICDGAHQNISV